MVPLTLTSLLLTVVILALVFYLISLLPMEERLRRLLTFVAALGVILWLLRWLH